MHRSSAPARIITTLVTLLAVPIALVAFSSGGAPWLRAVHRRMTLEMAMAQVPPASLGLLALGVALMVVVGLLGIWSSAGLLASSLYAVAFTAAAMVPSLTEELTRALMGVLPGQLGLDGGYGLNYGAMAVVTLTLPALGGVLAIARRRPVRSLALAVVGMILSPVLLLAGTVLMVVGIAGGLSSQVLAGFATLQFSPTAVVLIGAVLIVLGVAVAVVAPYALLVPALVAILLTVVFLTPLPFGLLVPGQIGGLPTLDATSTFQVMLMTGAGPGLAALFVAFTVAVAVVRRSSDRPSRPVATS